MKRFAKTSGLVLTMALLCTTIGLAPAPKDFKSGQAKYALADDYVPSGDTSRGARWTLNATTEQANNAYATMKLLLPTGKQDLSGNGLFVRMKNNTAIDSPILFSMNGTNNHRVSASKGTGSYVLYDASGANPVSKQSGRNWDHYLVIPASFDGFVYMEYGTELIDDETWSGNTGTEMTYNSVYGLYFTATTYYEGFTDLTIGDVFSDKKASIDASALTDEEFNAAFVKDQTPDGMNITRLVSTVFQPQGSLDGGADLSVKGTTDDLAAYFCLKFPSDKQDISGDGIYMRMKNNTTTETPIQFYMNGTNNHRMRLPANGTIYSYDSNGENKADLLTRSWPSYIMLPSSFDGFIYIPYSVLEDSPTTEWVDNATTAMTYNSVYALYFGISTKYDNYAAFTIGDVFTATSSIYVGSSVAAADFGTFFCPDYNGNYWTIAQHSGGYVAPVKEFEYDKIPYTGEYEGGAHLSFTAGTAASDFTSMDIYPTVKDISGANAVSFRLFNIAGDFPMLINLVDDGGKILHLGGTTVGNVKFVSEGTASNGVWGGNPISIKTPTPFNGEMVVPFKSLTGDADFDYTKLNHININVAVYYDYNFNNVFGDVGMVKEDMTYTSILDVSSLSTAGFGSAFSLSGSKEYGKLSRYESAKPSTWIGDTKIIDSLNYIDDDALKEKVVYNTGDNCVTYNKRDDGMFVHIGPYEAGHTYGSYMALSMADKGRTTDRKAMTRTVGSETETAKGITMYLKNLSRREIGINLQFDENGTSAKGSSAERWLVKSYPAMYYAYDVKTGANYTMFAKSDQIQIPVGFEGYVRIPFSSYSVPDWCHGDGFPGTDDQINLANFSGNLILTSDNTRYEDLEFFIKNIGVYFNATSAGVIDSAHTIKSNMGL